MNKDLLHRYHSDVWDGGHLDHAAQYLDPSFTSHAVVTTLPAGQQVGADFLAQFRIGFPDLRSHEDALLGDGDLVVIRWTITGTHTGTFFGVAATGRTIQVAGMDILRVADGKLVEHWGGVADQMDDFLTQIGALAR
jgi:predicted ester cyclase